jgi:leucyl-tRNA synthetase
VQVNGKVRGRVTVSPEIADDELQKVVLSHPTIRPYTQDKTIKKVVIAKGRLVSIVVA